MFLLGVFGCLSNFCIRSSLCRCSLFTTSLLRSSRLRRTTTEQSLPRLCSTVHAAIPILLAAFSAFVLPFTFFFIVVLFRRQCIYRHGCGHINYHLLRHQ